MTPPVPVLPPECPAVLRQWTSGDADELFRSFTDEEVLRHSWPSVRPYRRRDAIEYLAARELDAIEGGEVQWAVTDRDSGAILGGTSVYGWRPATQTAAIGYWLIAAARGRGVATLAVMALADWSFPALSAQRLEITCGPANVASQRVAVRAGFTFEGVLRAAVPFQGARRDSLLYSLLPDDR